MAGTFDPYNKESWYFGPLTRQQTEQLLHLEDDVGVFLVRNSSSIQGDLVLCVKEDNRVSHYIINKIVQADDQIRFRIGDELFPDVPALLHHYKTTLLDTTTLLRPIERLDALEKVVAKYDFPGRDPDDLPFRRGDMLYIVCKEGEHGNQWWTARNLQGRLGVIPVPYVESFEAVSAQNGSSDTTDSHRSSPPSISSHPEMRNSLNWASPSLPRQQNNSSNFNNNTAEHSMSSSTNGTREAPSYTTPNIERTLPAKAKVIQGRIPSPYDKTALRLLVGDIITVTKMNINGQWEGELNGKVGHFPFTHVKFIDEESSAQE